MKIDSKSRLLFLFDELSQKKSLIHNINPIVKLFITLIYIISIVSFPKYEFIALIPFLIYPILISAIADIPLMELNKRFIFVIPVILGVVLFDFKALPSLTLKLYLTVIGALLLITTTKISDLLWAFNKLKVPKILILQLMLTYRYIYILIDEVKNVFNAYKLRAPFEKGIKISIIGPLIGQLFIRTICRSEEIYDAMKVRGFNGEYNILKNITFNNTDLIYTFSLSLLFIASRYFNIPISLGKIVIEVMQ